MMRSNRLAVLAGEIRAAHIDVEAAQQTTVTRAKEAGIWLKEARTLVRQQQGHGHWMQWVKTELKELSTRSVRRYIQITQLSDEELATLANSTLEAGLQVLRTTENNDDEPDDNEEPPEPPEWTDDQLERKERAEAGECVVANMREGEDGQRRDQALIAWAEAIDRFVRIDRASQWGNVFRMPEDGDRAEVIGKFEKFYLPHKPGLLDQIPDLIGKVLGCWCYPEQCHGDVIATVVNDAGSSCRSPHEIAEELAEQDG